MDLPKADHNRKSAGEISSGIPRAVLVSHIFKED